MFIVPTMIIEKEIILKKKLSMCQVYYLQCNNVCQYWALNKWH